MKKMMFVLLIFSCLMLLVGCDTKEVASNGVTEESQSIPENMDVVSTDEPIIDGTAISGTAVNGEEYVDPVKIREEINANAYHAEKQGAKSLVKENDYKVDIVVGDDYYATQLADMMVNFDKFEGKVVEIEGFALKNGPYTFEGRYSENAICPTCPAGYAYYEFEWHGDEKIDLGDELNWIKVTGKLTRGNDGQEYFYIDTYRIDVMEKWGDVSTVSN